MHYASGPRVLPALGGAGAATATGILWGSVAALFIIGVVTSVIVLFPKKEK